MYITGKVEMIKYIILGFLSFIFGIVLTLIITKQFLFNSKTNEIENDECKKISENKEEIHLKHVEEVINYVKSGKKFPFYLKPEVLEALKIIASKPEYSKALDDETIKNIETIYFRLMKAKNNNKVFKTAKGEGFNNTTYWEGTEEEYFEALENGVINENTNVHLIVDDKNWHGSWLRYTENGSVEEYMD